MTHPAPSLTHPAPSRPILKVENLFVELARKKVVTPILWDVSLSLQEAGMLGLVGETGSGKTMTARAIIGLLPPGIRIKSGSITLGGRELRAEVSKELREIRGAQIGMVFQNPRTALYPMSSVEAQMDRVLRAHLDLSRRDRTERIHQYLKLVGIDDARRVARSYPHELSGGMAQRVVIATSLLCEPTVLIADEPTTGLDATIQRQILELIADLQAELSLSVLIITHDLGIVAQYCDSVSVMNDGRVVEQGPKRQVLKSPADEYSERLIAASDLRRIRRAKPSERK